MTLNVMSIQIEQRYISISEVASQLRITIPQVEDLLNNNKIKYELEKSFSGEFKRIYFKDFKRYCAELLNNNLQE